MANIRSVSLYSYQEEFFFGRLTLEGMIAEAAKTGARGIEFLAEQYAPDEYADPSDLFINEWNEWMDKYGVTPSCLDTSCAICACPTSSPSTSKSAL